jgi:uncharacterized caspase-like protein
MKNSKTVKKLSHNPELTYRYKKIKEYVYDMESTLGQGNFSTVYKGRNQDKSISCPILD